MNRSCVASGTKDGNSIALMYEGTMLFSSIQSHIHKRDMRTITGAMDSERGKCMSKMLSAKMLLIACTCVSPPPPPSFSNLGSHKRSGGISGGGGGS